MDYKRWTHCSGGGGGYGRGARGESLIHSSAHSIFDTDIHFRSSFLHNVNGAGQPSLF